MKNLVSLIVFALVFLGLGAMALMAAPGGADLVSEFNPSMTAGQTPVLNNVNAAAATSNFNFIAIPLDATDSIAPFKASGLAGYYGSGVTQVLYWNSSTQTFTPYIPGVSPPPLNFDLEVGGAYMMLIDNDPNNADVISFVGDVPGQGTISHDIVPAATGCSFDALTIPLDRADLSKALTLANDIEQLSGINSVTQVLDWDASAQRFTTYVPGVSPPSLNFTVKIGYPYMVCTNGSATEDWK